MPAYKLVVVSPFESFKRGDLIYDQDLVEKICNPKSELHEYERNVRRVLMNDVEMQQYVAPLEINKQPSIQAQPLQPLQQPQPEIREEPDIYHDRQPLIEEMRSLHIESIKEIGE